MKGQSNTPGGPPVSLEMKEAPPLPGEYFSTLLADFPDPILVTDSRGKVAFLNHAAKRLFGKTLRLGDPCPICSRISGVEVGAEYQDRLGRCLGYGESFNRVPILIQGPWATPVPFSVTAAPIRSDGDQRAGCLVALRDWHEDLLAHPEVQLQTATLSSILENFPTPFFMVDPDLKITHINERMEKITGYSRQEVMGRMTCGAVLNTVQCGTDDCVLMQVMKHKRPMSGLRRVVRDRQGREIHVVVSASIITDLAGRVIGGFEAIRDITPLVEAEKKIELLTELTQEGILMVDENQRVLLANSRMAHIVRRPKEELVGQDVGEILSEQHRQMAAEMVRMVEEGHQEESRFCSTLDQPLLNQREQRIFETCMSAARIGKNILTCLYLRDLTDRMRVHEQLHKTNIFLNNIIRQSFDGIVVIDKKGNPLIFSEGAERILGFKAQEAIANPKVFRRFYPIPLAQEIMRRMRSDKYGGPDKLETTQITFLNKDGEEVPVNFSAAIIRDRGEEIGSVGIFSDLREHLKMRQELEWSQIMQAEKITSLGRLAAGVAHEVNNPLAGILIYAEMLQRQMAEDAEGRANVVEIINQTLRCQQIVNRLLEFSRKSLGQKILLDVNQTITRCVELISHQAFFHNIEIIQELDPNLPQIVADQGQLQQVFTNLLLNSADAMNGSGRITITSRTAPEENGVILSFTDTGMGIPPEIQERIFEPFFTTKPPGAGTGLGLSIVHGIIQRHGGSVEVCCPPEGGTTFTIRLPLENRENLE